MGDRVRARVTVRDGASQRCPWCRDSLVADSLPLVRCGVCKTEYHADCTDSCGTLGCAGELAPVRARTESARSSVTRDSFQRAGTRGLLLVLVLVFGLGIVLKFVSEIGVNAGLIAGIVVLDFFVVLLAGVVYSRSLPGSSDESTGAAPERAPPANLSIATPIPDLLRRPSEAEEPSTARDSFSRVEDPFEESEPPPPPPTLASRVDYTASEQRLTAELEAHRRRLESRRGRTPGLGRTI